MTATSRICFAILLAFAAILPAGASAEDLKLGTVERLDMEYDLAVVKPVEDRPRVMPEEIVHMQSRIPGIDELAETAKGYIRASENDTLRLTVTEGEPGLGDEVILHKGEFLNGKATLDEKIWRRMGYEDLRAGINKPPNVAALCVLARKLEYGEGVEANMYDAYVLRDYAMRFEPSTDCIVDYAQMIRAGDMDNTPPKWRADRRRALELFLYTAEQGHYQGMMSYAGMMELDGAYDVAEKWTRKALAIEPEVLKKHNAAQSQLDRILKKKRRR